jgi:hypothetical protein
MFDGLLIFDGDYFWVCFCLMTAVTLFAMSNAVIAPFFYRRWFSSRFKWHIYFAICHLISTANVASLGSFEIASGCRERFT